MRRLESMEDDARGVVTYALENGQRISLDRRAVQEYGAAQILRDMGYAHLLPTERVVVFQRGEKVGTLPPDFDPLSVKSQSFLYDVRPGDFIRDGDKWIAARNLGPGDLEAIPGFVWERR